jgi:hypothetical protein
MDGLRRNGRFLASAVGLVFLIATVSPAFAVLPDPIGTQELSEARDLAERRVMVQEALAREDVRRELLRAGVDPGVVEARVDSLSASELEQLAAGLDQLPAGGNSIVGALVFVFIVLLVTDLLGLTDVFPFTK